MARYTDAVCRLCRREKMKLYLKGDKCFSAKCLLEKRNYPPGMSGAVEGTGRGSRKKTSEFGQQLREKQKARRIYGVLERQFRKTFAEAERGKGVTGENLVRLLESRLDNVIFRMGFASSRKAARQLVRHGHVRIGGRKVSIPSYQVRPGDEVTLKNPELLSVRQSAEAARKRNRPDWLEVDFDRKTGKVLSNPTRDSLEIPVQDKLIIELYSR